MTHQNMNHHIFNVAPHFCHEINRRVCYLLNFPLQNYQKSSPGKKIGQPNSFGFIQNPNLIHKKILSRLVLPTLMKFSRALV
ncbi:hypothetical protein HYC85_005969 [Camellia sinensis]|uniref:Uncharacterized protein n=1 Tax=Camellia sinensis TaxID=4442 RepID=A0A7J7I2T7_CAMSI|nr:hypothetical protein HYC85_005969 [Camellia sinensis]